MLELLREGLEVAILGMTAVFVLLGCLVLAVGGMSRMARRLEPEVGTGALPSSNPAGDETELTVAVTAAVHAYRKRKRT